MHWGRNGGAWLRIRIFKQGNHLLQCLDFVADPLEVLLFFTPESMQIHHECYPQHLSEGVKSQTIGLVLPPFQCPKKGHFQAGSQTPSFLRAAA